QLAVPTSEDEAAALSLIVCPECGASVFGAPGAASPAEPEARAPAPEAPPCCRQNTRWLGLLFVLIFWALAGHLVAWAIRHVPLPLWGFLIGTSARASVVSVAEAVRSALARRPRGRDLSELDACPECGRVR